MQRAQGRRACGQQIGAFGLKRVFESEAVACTNETLRCGAPELGFYPRQKKINGRAPSPDAPWDRDDDRFAARRVDFLEPTWYLAREMNSKDLNGTFYKFWYRNIVSR